jgi:hypothetical protein
MEAGLASLARQPGKRDEFLLCLYDKISHTQLDSIVSSAPRRYKNRIQIGVLRN